MTKITRQELLKLAHLSQLKLHEQEIESVSKQIEDVLSYAARVKEIASQAESIDFAYKNKNVFRKDVAIACKSEEILALAPERQDNYFVVPKIIESK